MSYFTLFRLLTAGGNYSETGLLSHLFSYKILFYPAKTWRNRMKINGKSANKIIIILIFLQKMATNASGWW